MDVDADMDVDYAAVKMVVMDGIVMGPTTICAPCGVVIAWTKFDKAESPTNILQFLEDVYPTEETSIANKSWEMWSRTSRFIVDSYHYINHQATDYLCRKWCNPAPLDGSAPNLVVVATDNNGKPYYQRAFNTQARGFESILRRMTPGNFNWFLHVMLFYHTRYVIDRQKQKAKQNQVVEEVEEDEDEVL
ncbi:hypothetical protein BD779DRAFT_1612302 [Infundibulicybe gibba]|nr:hypothetical protein BD779DRAFT_1612302 [Infundibulicybe gibba]